MCAVNSYAEKIAPAFYAQFHVLAPFVFGVVHRVYFRDFKFKRCFRLVCSHKRYRKQLCPSCFIRNGAGNRIFLADFKRLLKFVDNVPFVFCIAGNFGVRIFYSDVRSQCNCFEFRHFAQKSKFYVSAVAHTCIRRKRRFAFLFRHFSVVLHSQCGTRNRSDTRRRK